MNTVRVYSKTTGLTASVYQIRKGGWVTWDSDKQPIFMDAKKVIPFLLEKVKTDKPNCIIRFIKKAK